MYQFIDTNETSAGVLLPAEALKINGEYIENLIDGYRTLSVEGREALSPELATYETGVMDGSKLQSKRYPARTLIIKYQLIAKSAEEFRAAYNKLAAILNVENAELIFNDEQDKYFTGTPSAIGSVEPGRNAVIGEFEILCADPFKYSVIEYEATPDLESNSILIDYNGTYKSYPVLQADFYSESEVAEDGETTQELTGEGDCGYVAFFNENEKIIQLGDPDESNAENYERSQTLTHQNFTSEFGWGSSAQALWTLNGGNVLGSGVYQTGAVAISPSTYDIPIIPETSATILKVRSTSEKPYVDYKITAKATGRTEKTVKVKLSVTTSLASSNNYFGKGRNLKGSIQIGGEWHDFMIKNEGDYWRGNSGHIKNIEVVLTDLEANTDLIENIKFKVTRTDNKGKTGILDETKCSDLEISKYIAPIPETYYLSPSNYGNIANKENGPAITRVLPADASGETGASFFTLSYGHKFCVGNSKKDIEQQGCFEVNITDAAGKNIAGARIVKYSSGVKARLELYINNKCVNKVLSVDASYNNATPTIHTITKNGSKITFKIFGQSKTYNIPEIANAKATKFTFLFSDYGQYKSPLSYNGISWVKFVKHNCDTYKDIPNKFSSNDTVEAVCKSGEVLLNGINAPELGALGNDWEEFCLTPGLNQIGFAYSDWVQAAPAFKVRYREVFL